MQAKNGEKHVGAESTHQHQLGVRQVDDAHDPEDEVQPAGEQRVEHARQQAADQQLQQDVGFEQFHGGIRISREVYVPPADPWTSILQRLPQSLNG